MANYDAKMTYTFNSNYFFQIPPKEGHFEIKIGSKWLEFQFWVSKLLNDRIKCSFFLLLESGLIIVLLLLVTHSLTHKVCALCQIAKPNHATVYRCSSMLSHVFVLFVLLFFFQQKFLVLFCRIFWNPIFSTETGSLTFINLVY